MSILSKWLLIGAFMPSIAWSFQPPDFPKYVEGGILIEANDAGEMVVESLDAEDGLLHPSHHKYFHHKVSFQTLSEVITPRVEEAFDLFIFANVSYERYGSPNDYIPSQRLRIFRKKVPGSQIFNRDMLGNIQAHNPVSSSAWGTSDHQPAFPGLPGEILISSGASQRGEDYVDTFSGVFRMNHVKSRTHRYQEGMIDSLYVDIVYPWGKVSGIAVHGTPKGNYWALGQQASHGCVRIKQSVASPLYAYAMGQELYDPYLLDFSQKQRVPSGPLRNSRKGQKVLMIFFYGYDGNQGLDI